MTVWVLCTDMEWLSCQDASHDLLVALHPPYNIVLWNTDTGIKLWKKSYTETLLGFVFDPFDPCRMACEYYNSIIFPIKLQLCPWFSCIIIHKQHCLGVFF